MSKVAKDKNPTINKVQGLSVRHMGLAKPIHVLKKEALEALKKHRAKKK